MKMKPLDYILNNETEVLEFLRQHYPMYHQSNVFFRDIQYGIRTMLERRGERLSYTESENLARAFVEKLEQKQILRPVDRQSWVLNYPAFRKPPVVQAAPARQAPGAAPAKSPAATRPAAAAGARQPLPPLSSAKPAGSPAARPAGGLPPLKSAQPVGGAPQVAPAPRPTDGQAPSQPTEQSAQPQASAPAGAATETLKQPVEQSAEKPEAQASGPAADQQQSPKRTLPPLKGNYKPVGKA